MCFSVLTSCAAQQATHIWGSLKGGGGECLTTKGFPREIMVAFPRVPVGIAFTENSSQEEVLGLEGSTRARGIARKGTPMRRKKKMVAHSGSVTHHRDYGEQRPLQRH